MNLLIKNTRFLDLDSDLGFRENQDIVVQANRIKSIKPTGDNIEGIEILDGSNLFITPGFINAHTHSTENLLRGSSEKIPLEKWLFKQFNEAPIFTPELTYLSALLGVMEMLKSGTTAVMDHLWITPSINCEILDSVMSAYAFSGMRASVAPMLEDQDLFTIHSRSSSDGSKIITDHQKSSLPFEKIFDYVEQFIEKWHKTHNDRLRCLPGPGGLQWCSEKLLNRSLQLSDQYNTGLHMHLNETRLQAEICSSYYGRSAVSQLQKLGILNQSTSLAHAVWVDDEDIEILAKACVSVVHNPISNLKLASGIAPIIKMLNSRMNIALGADGAASNDNQDMFSVMKITGLIHNPAILKSKDWISSKEVLCMATSGGSKVLGHKDGLGKIQEGYLADLVFHDYKYFLNKIINDPLQMLVYSTTGSSIKHVMVDGNWLIKDNSYIRFDEEEILHEINIHLNNLLDKAQ